MSRHFRRPGVMVAQSINTIMFKPTYLYVKTHNVTGLKYFGKTVKADPFKYKGSGEHWVNHIKKHGYDVTTEIVGYYTDKDECVNAAIEFSKINNIVESKDWANLIVEDGCNKFEQQITAESSKKRKNTILNRYGDDYFAKIATVKKSEQHIENIRKAILASSTLGNSGKKNLGKIRALVECPHCKKQGAINTMSRWHFDNCKQKNGDLV